MKVVQINTFPYKATGTIMLSIHKELLSEGYESYVVWGRGREANDHTELSIEDAWGIRIHGLLTRVFDATGFGSINATKRLIDFLERIKPDIVHLHNIHGYYLNIELLFEYLKSKKIKVVWTLHDCWPITGHCANFETVECSKWIAGCHTCIQKNEYPSSYLFDRSKINWGKKKKLFTGMNIVIVTPSNWLKGVIEKSYLKEHRIVVINNGIDLDVFRPVESKFRNRYGLTDKKIVLGVASEWLKRKGLEDFLKLRNLLDPSFSIVMVGLNKKQLNCLPEGIIGIERTNDVTELVDIYSSADLFLNATYEDIYPTVNMEALACGTPVLTYDTGGAMEAANLTDYEKRPYGKAFRKSSNSKVDYEPLKNIIEEMTKEVKNVNECRNAARGFSKTKQNKMYIELYLSIYNGEL